MEIDEEAAALGVMDALLPGGCGFPKASETGMGAVLLDRLRRADATLPARLAAAVRAADEAFDPRDEAAVTPSRRSSRPRSRSCSARSGSWPT